jgi:hypothetical protein
MSLLKGEDGLCGCITCHLERRSSAVEERPFGMAPGFRYCCEICGNKRCPHHTDHRLACTNSNATGQFGSVYA